MGLRNVLRRLVGSGEEAGDPWAGTPDDDLDRLWRARHAFGDATRLSLRDAFVARDRPFPFAAVPSAWGPIVGGLDEALDREGLGAYLRQLDPYARTGELVRPFRGGVLVGSDGAASGAVGFLLPRWDPEVRRGVEPLPLAEGEPLTALFVLNDGEAGWLPTGAVLEASGIREAVPVHALDGEAPVDRPPPELSGRAAAPEATTFPHEDPVGPMHVTRLETTPEALAVHVADRDTGEETRVLIGPAVPPDAIPARDTAAHVVGGLQDPDGEDLAASLEQAGWDGTAAAEVEGLHLLADASGVDPEATRRVGGGMGLRPRLVGRGTAVPKTARPLLAGDDDGEPGDEAAREADGEAVEAALAHLLAEGDEAGAGRLLDRLEAVRGREARIVLLRGFLAELAGRTDEAARLYEEAAGATSEEEDGVPGLLAAVEHARHRVEAGDPEAARSRLEGAAEALDEAGAEEEPGLDANRPLVLWLAGEPDEAAALFQETHVGAGSWLGSLLEATLHDGAPEADAFGLFSALGLRLAPLLDALAHLRGGAFEEAERLLRRALELEPRHPAARGGLVGHLTRSGRADEAEALAEEGLGRMPRFAYLRALRASIQLDAERYEEAADELARALEAAPEHADWRWNRILALQALGRGEAVRDEVEALAANGADMALVTALRKRFRG